MPSSVTITSTIHVSTPLHVQLIRPVTGSTNGSREELDVNLGEDLSFQLQAFTLKSDFSVANIALNTSTDTSLKLVSSTTGKLAFIAMVGSNANYEVGVKINGVRFSGVNGSRFNDVPPPWGDGAVKSRPGKRLRI